MRKKQHKKTSFEVILLTQTFYLFPPPSRLQGGTGPWMDEVEQCRSNYRGERELLTPRALALPFRGREFIFKILFS